MNLKRILIIVIMCGFFQGYGQIAPDKYFIQFTDKMNSPYSMDHPEAFLTQRALERRERQGIPIEENDIPVNPQYLQGVADKGAVLLNATRWLNGVTIYTDNPDVVDSILTLPYVANALKLAVGQDVVNEKNFFKSETYGDVEQGEMSSPRLLDELDYGAARHQIDQINGIPLHDLGFMGQGMVIAVLDGGFDGVQQHPVFDSLWSDGRLLGTKDFVYPHDQNVFTESQHGKSVLSTMAAYWPGHMIGTAPLASYWLLRSEEVYSENVIEEYNWISAAEFADSVGADLINSSLSYRDFDLPQWNHSYEDLDGNTAVSSIGADIAASKGILVCTSAGNSAGSDFPWNAAPAVADSVLSIGAIDRDGNWAVFSSVGPTVDGRIKPAVVALGQSTTVARDTTWVGTGSGTSFSSPIMTGMSACLWQADRNMKVMQIEAAIRFSASNAASPNDTIGWGIPDFMRAYTTMTTVEHQADNGLNNIRVWPNPFHAKLFVQYYGDEAVKSFSVEMYDMQGRLLFKEEIPVFNGKKTLFSNKLAELNKGVYMLRISSGTNFISRKVIKQ